jgi:signal peptide peptidase SppA
MTSLQRDFAAADLASGVWAGTPNGARAALAAIRTAPLARKPLGRTPTSTGRVAVIPITGVLTQRASFLSMFGLGTSLERVGLAIDLALLDDSISCIVLDLDSEGGSVYGVPELAAKIRASTKPVPAIANSLAASGAYWLAAAATEIYVAPGGDVGGIGCVAIHQDLSGALKKAGIATTLISAGKFKTEGNPYGPLDREAQKFMQSRVADYAGMFERDVAKGRRVSVETVRKGFGQGRVVGADQAKAAGMVDGICTLDALVRSLSKRGSVTSGQGASARLHTAVALYEAARG